jgi:hypothetical protein
MGETLDASPARHLQTLLARAQNPFDVSDRVLQRLTDAVLCRVEVRTGRPDCARTATVRHGSSMHAFLLSDGGVQTLWELWHLEAGPPHTRPRFEIYEREDALRASELRAYGPPVVPEQAPPVESGPLPGRMGADEARSLPAEAARTRSWSRDDSPDHARRLLRRARNPDRPGAETLRLLADACGHAIVHVPRPRSCPPGRHLWCSLYEHAFLLPDGREVRLYELEHDLTESEGLVCEVYPDETVADRAARGHVRARGIDT